MVSVYCKNTGTYKEFQEGTSLLDMLPSFEFEQPFPIVSAKVNNVSQGLKFRVYNNREVEYVDVTSPCAMRVYTRSLFFLLFKAAHETFKGCRTYLEHPISGGFYCNIKKKDDSPLSDQDLEVLKEAMWKIVEEDVAFHRREVQVPVGIKLFRDLG